MSGPAAQISLTDFTNSLLAPWFADSAAGQAGDAVSSPRDAAAMGAFAAAVTHAGKRGVVLVTAPDASSARSCFEYARAYFSDQEQLSRLVKAISSDTIELRGGVKLVITPDATRRPKGLLATIRLVPPPSPYYATPETGYDLARRFWHVIADAWHSGDRARAIALIKPLAPPGEDPVETLDGMIAREKATNEKRVAAANRKRATVVGSTELLPPSMEDYNRPEFCSPEWERRRAERMGLQPEPRQTRAMFGKRGA